MNDHTALALPLQAASPRQHVSAADTICVWTPRDLDVLETLTRRLRMLQIAQIRDIWWPGQATCRFARRRLKLLCAAGLLERTVINAHPLLAVQEPLASWLGNGKPRDFRRISRRARERWDKAPVPMEVWTASRRAANLFGTNCHGLPPLLHRDHDLLLSQVFVMFRRARPQDAQRWLGEDALPKAGYLVKDPDAFLISDDGIPSCVIESAGRYSPRQIKSFHEHCAEHDLPYELW